MATNCYRDRTMVVYYLRRMGRSLKHDLAGQRFGMLDVIERCDGSSSAVTWLCKCDCGNEVQRTTSGLLNAKNPPNCGCQGNPKNRRYETAQEATVAAFRRRYEYDARKRNLKWFLTSEDFERIIHTECFYCGSPPTKRWNVYKKYKRSGTQWIEEADVYLNGLDRKDNQAGYTIDNCVPCCSECNYAKRSTHADDFLTWIERVHQHQQKQDHERRT